MDYGVDLRARGIAAQMYLELAGGLVPRESRGLYDLVVGVHLDEHIRREHSLAGAGWGSNEIAVRQARGDVAVVSRHEAELPQFVTDLAYCFPDLLFSHVLVPSCSFKFSDM